MTGSGTRCRLGCPGHMRDCHVYSFHPRRSAALVFAPRPTQVVCIGVSSPSDHDCCVHPRACTALRSRGFSWDHSLCMPSLRVKCCASIALARSATTGNSCRNSSSLSAERMASHCTTASSKMGEATNASSLNPDYGAEFRDSDHPRSDHSIDSLFPDGDWGSLAPTPPSLARFDWLATSGAEHSNPGHE